MVRQYLTVLLLFFFAGFCQVSDCHTIWTPTGDHPHSTSVSSFISPVTPPSPSLGSSSSASFSSDSDLYGESNTWIANVGSLERDDFENKKRSRNNYEQIVGRCKKVMDSCKQHVSFLSCIAIRPRKIMSDQERCGDAAESQKKLQPHPKVFSVLNH